MDKLSAKRYQGYKATPSLWRDSSITPFKQIEHPECPGYPPTVLKNHRLGKLVEEYLFYQLKQAPGIEWVADNLQIQQEKITVGEIDALYYDHGIPVHLEVAYKFYLYDPLADSVGPLASWIGPNRKDNLALKLEKLRSKQFPLLHNPLAKKRLTELGLEPGSVEQRLCFLGQLYVPYYRQNTDIAPLNPTSVAGFYLPFRQLSALSDFDFFIPEKLDWLIVPHLHVGWIDYATAVTRVEVDIKNERSPLVWLRSAEGDLRKCFVVFW